ncbi:MAG TPA: NFACT RNA binding domain-containing protein [Candidatus Kapabacteria bacterium]|nr:NFACT RNA binding domain-containing protein [Candidatus Kapabacteria bacterium]
MLIHYFTLLKLAENFQNLIGSKIIEAYSQEKDTAILQFYNGSQIINLKFSALPNFECIFLHNDEKKKSNSINLFQNIYGETLKDIRAFENNRMLEFEFTNSHIYFLLFSKSKNNLVCTDKYDDIVYALNNNKTLAGTHFHLPQTSTINLTDLPKDETILKALSNSDLNLGKYYAQEFLYKYNINADIQLSDFSSAELNEIYNKANIFRDEILKNNTYYILENDKRDTLFSLIPLQDYPKIRFQTDDINQAIHRTYALRLSQYKFKKLYSQLYKIAKSNTDRYAKKLDDTKNIEKIIDLSNKYKKYGELLISSNIQNIKGKDEIEIVDYEGNIIRIPLDKKLNIKENASKYFDKYKSLQKQIKLSDSQQKDYESKYLEWQEIFDELQKIDNLKSLKSHFKKWEQFYKKFMETKDKDISERFRKFELDADWTVYVGKNSENNDELTFRFAKPQDYWFHIRGASGSHTVLRGDKNTAPPKDIIRQAASIAAYYSSQRNAKYVPVAYTQRKYVRKPKGANPGAVVISKEEVVMVEPGLPNNM